VKRYIVPLSIAGVLAVAVAIGLLVWFSVAGWWPIVVDIVIVITCIVSLVMLGLLGMAITYLTITLLQVRRELTPVLESVKSTSQTVSQTARVASALGVAPGVRTASVLMGAAEVATVILGRGHVRARAQKRARRRQEVERELLARGELDGRGG
jgi:hypothetical protein